MNKMKEQSLIEKTECEVVHHYMDHVRSRTIPLLQFDLSGTISLRLIPHSTRMPICVDAKISQTNAVFMVAQLCSTPEVVKEFAGKLETLVAIEGLTQLFSPEGFGEDPDHEDRLYVLECLAKVPLAGTMEARLTFCGGKATALFKADICREAALLCFQYTMRKKQASQLRGSSIL